MKKMIITLCALSSIHAFANFDFQMSHIKGDWDFGNKGEVFRIYEQTDKSIKILKCDREDWLASSGAKCNYTNVFVAKYNRFFDGFCLANKCSNGYQVSKEFPSQMVEIADPLAINDVSNSGEVLGYATKP